MTYWNSSPRPISDLRDWCEAQRLEIRPDPQRQGVWSFPARVMLMDTIIRGIPMPKILLANTIRGGKTYRIVIDGQQRVGAILDFLRDGFALGKPYTGSEAGKKFSDLSNDTQDRFLSYPIDFNEATNLTEEEVREVYARVNKYTVPLTKQELRRADFPGDFLSVSENLSIHQFFDDAGIFSPANRRRYADVEYVSELLAAMIAGAQDKKSSLDNFYINYAKWDKNDKKQIIARFEKALHELELIFGGVGKPLSKTRFRQKADFYTLFLAVDGFAPNGDTVAGKDLRPLGKDLTMLDEHIRPESEFDICKEYAIKCISQANSASSRKWRQKLMHPILAGTFHGTPPTNDTEGVDTFYRLVKELMPAARKCPACHDSIADSDTDRVLAWRKADGVCQMSNSHWAHKSCVAGKAEWAYLDYRRYE